MGTPDRGAAADRLSANALAATEVVGLTANAEFLRSLVDHPRFRANGDFHTRLIEERMEDFAAGRTPDPPDDEDLGDRGVGGRHCRTTTRRPGTDTGVTDVADGGEGERTAAAIRGRHGTAATIGGLNGAGERIVRLRLWSRRQR